MSWCSSSLSWDSWFVKGYRKCELTISPFGDTIVTVVPEDAVLKQKKLSCSQAERSELSLQLLVSGLAGLVLFYTAPHLATSVAFRVSVGGTLSVFLCTLIIAIFFFRSASQPCPCCCCHSVLDYSSAPAPIIQERQMMCN